MTRLTLMCSRNPDDATAELHATVDSGGFSGSGSAWFNIDEIAAFCASLSTYPIDPAAAPSIKGGYWDASGKLAESHLSIRIEPSGSTGALKAIVNLALPYDGREVRTWLIVGYNDLDRFRADLAKSDSSGVSKATLTSTLG